MQRCEDCNNYRSYALHWEHKCNLWYFYQTDNQETAEYPLIPDKYNDCKDYKLNQLEHGSGDVIHKS